MIITLTSTAAVARPIRLIVAPVLFFLVEFFNTAPIQFPVSPHFNVAPVLSLFALTIAGCSFDASELPLLALDASGNCFQLILGGVIAGIALTSDTVLVPFASIPVWFKIRLTATNQFIPNDHSVASIFGRIIPTKRDPVRMEGTLAIAGLRTMVTSVPLLPVATDGLRANCTRSVIRIGTPYLFLARECTQTSSLQDKSPGNGKRIAAVIVLGTFGRRERSLVAAWIVR